MKKSILLLSSLLAMTSCAGGSPEIQVCLQGSENTPSVQTIKNEKDGSETYSFISVVFALVDQDATLNITTADFTARSENTTHNAISFVDSYGLSSSSGNSSYYIISTSTSKEIKMEDGEQPGSVYITFDDAVDSSYSFYYKNTKLVANEYVGI